MVKAGLTGNYGSGKSLVLKLFERLGAFTLSADEIVGELLRNSGVLTEIEKIAGPDVLEVKEDKRGLNKAKLARVIFSDTGKRRKLENLLHPLVMDRIRNELETSRAGLAVVEVPLLFEAGYEGTFDKTITVSVSEETALRRLGGKGIPRKEALMRLRSQMPISEKAKRADYVIDNEGTPEETEIQVEKIYRELSSGK